MIQYTLDQLKKAILAKGYAWFENGQLNLNIVGIRSNTSKSNDFDDMMYVMFKNESNVWITKRYPCTTDPGKPYLLKPLSNEGTAILVPGQYRGAFIIGIHGKSHKDGGYKALEQVKPLAYVRDNNKDEKIDCSLYSDPKNIVWEIAKTNIHRASAYAVSKLVETYSAGCQVLASPVNFDELMFLCEKSRMLYGNSFTYTLIEEKDITV